VNAGFQNNPALRWLSESGPITQVLVEPLVYESVAGDTIVIPQGFVTDYATIPRVFWNIIPPDGDARFPAILHDYLYSLRGWAPYFKTRAQCDGLFLEAMRHVGVNMVERITIYSAVRCFGWAFSLGKNKDGRAWKK
jgi:Protein of unknown function (DUF1353)